MREPICDQRKKQGRKSRVRDGDDYLERFTMGDYFFSLDFPAFVLEAFVE